MEKDQKKQKSIGDRMYNKEDYDKDGQLSSGLAQTHEQVTDTYTEGTIDAKIERENGEVEDIPRKGYE